MEDIKKPWYKTLVGVVFLAFMGTVLLTVLLFAGFFTYYTWQIKYGNVEELAKQFAQQKITTDASLLSRNQKEASAIDMEQYVRAYNPTFGAAEASITILAFIDFECPFSQEAYLNFKAFMQKYEPVVRVVFKYLPLENLHTDAVVAAEAAACAHEQAKFWDYHDILFTSKDLDTNSLIFYAKQLGLNVDIFSLCLATEKYSKEIHQDFLDAADLNLRGTPTYFVNDLKVEGSVDKETWDKIILSFLKE